MTLIQDPNEIVLRVIAERDLMVVDKLGHHHQILAGEVVRIDLIEAYERAMANGLPRA